MTATLMGRLFIVPALVVCVMLGVAVVVVLFGASSIEKPKSIEDLLAIIEHDSGDKTMGMLLPAAKESWQAAQELARRLDRKEKFLAPLEIEPVAARIVRILEKTSGGTPSGPDAGRAAQRGQARRLFLVSALGRLETATAVEPLTELLEDADAQTRRTALQALVHMRSVEAARQALPRIYRLLDDSDQAVQMVAILSVASLAAPGDAVAIREVARKLESAREVQWNAAIALARLGSKRGKLVLMNMLDRSFWEGLDLDYEEGNARVRRKFTEMEVTLRLRAAIDAGSYLRDEELRASIQRLSAEDRSHVVRDAARTALEQMGADQTSLAGPGWLPGIGEVS